MIQEECWIIQGRTILNKFWYGQLNFGTYSQGGCASVPFDLDYVLNQKNIIGFLHTHPFSSASPSWTDYQTMRGLCFTFGRPLLCIISGTDEYRNYWFLDDEQTPIESKVHYWRQWIYGFIPKKYGSYEKINW